MRKLKNFKSFLGQKTNEEMQWTSTSTSKTVPSWTSSSTGAKIIKWCKDKTQKLTGWSKKFYQSLEQGQIKLNKKGQPIAMLFAAANGDVHQQFMDFAKLGLVNEAIVPLSYTEEDASVRDVSAEELMEEIEQLYHEKTTGGPAKPIFIYGAPGIGKTAIVSQVARKLDIDLLNLDVQNMAMEDFVGVPSIENGRTVFNPPTNLPTDNGSKGKGGILFLDELNKADDYLLRKMNQFVQMGRINQYLLPNKWIIVAAGNRAADQVDIAQMDASFVQRWQMINYVPEVGVDDKGQPVRGFAKYVSGKKDVLPELVFFLAEKPEYFHRLDSEKAMGIFASPRSWELGAQKLNSVLQKKGLESWRQLPEQQLINIFHDAVGPESAGKFVEFLSVLRQLDDSEMQQILKDGDKVEIKKKFQTNRRYLYAIGDSLMRKVPENVSIEERDKMIYNIVKYIGRYGQFEILSWLIKKIRDTYTQWSMDKQWDKTEGDEWRSAAMKLYLENKKKAGV